MLEEKLLQGFLTETNKSLCGYSIKVVLLASNQRVGVRFTVSAPILFHDSNLGDRIPLLTEMESGSNPDRGANLTQSGLELVPAQAHILYDAGSNPVSATILKVVR